MSFDVQLLELLNQFARSAPALDVVITFITRSYLFKGAVMMTFVWWGWFRDHPDQVRHRQYLMSVLFAALATLITARLMAMALPHRTRPMHDLSVDMELPVGMPPMLPGWSSFPSDHAALFGCLATGMFLVSRRAGWIATAYCVLLILLPRVYNGLHYPSDLIAGYAIGALFVFLCSREFIMERMLRPVYHWFMQRPGLWYPLLFLFSYEVATLFDDLRQLGKMIYLIVDHFMLGDGSVRSAE